MSSIQKVVDEHESQAHGMTSAASPFKPTFSSAIGGSPMTAFPGLAALSAVPTPGTSQVANVIPDYDAVVRESVRRRSLGSQEGTKAKETEGAACSAEAVASVQGLSDHGTPGPQEQQIGDRFVNPTGVPAEYRDYSRVPVEDLRDPSAFIYAAASAKEPPFPVKLHRILCNPEFQDIVAWLPHGRSWRVLKPKAFEEKVIPLHFRHCRYSSFMRQVNGWGFKRVLHGPDLNSYYHELFLRGLPHLCLKMRRPTGKQSQLAAEAAKAPAPDFYSISAKFPLPDYGSSDRVSSSNNATVTSLSAGDGESASPAGEGCGEEQQKPNLDLLALARQQVASGSLGGVGGAFGDIQQRLLQQQLAQQLIASRSGLNPTIAALLASQTAPALGVNGALTTALAGIQIPQHAQVVGMGATTAGLLGGVQIPSQLDELAALRMAAMSQAQQQQQQSSQLTPGSGAGDANSPSEVLKKALVASHLQSLSLPDSFTNQQILGGSSTATQGSQGQGLI